MNCEMAEAPEKARRSSAQKAKNQTHRGVKYDPIACIDGEQFARFATEKIIGTDCRCDEADGNACRNHHRALEIGIKMCEQMAKEDRREYAEQECQAENLGHVGRFDFLIRETDFALPRLAKQRAIPEPADKKSSSCGNQYRQKICICHVHFLPAP